ncbi:MAG: hypothetical protein JW809_06020 [Pirellulales bacterium]|nr:hypothetical protein [Pirellulales bacterium]
MIRSRFVCAAFLLISVLFAVVAGIPARGADSASVKAQFAHPSRDYSSGPLWTWNDLLTEEQIVGTMEDLASQQVKQVWVHPRPGLMTPYLEKDWFRLWRRALAEAERLDMNVWIYDENSYPSGFAGGLVPEAMPESRGQGLHLEEIDGPPKNADYVALYRLTEGGFENVTAKARSGETLPAGRYLAGRIRLAQPSGWYGGKFYVDLIRPGVTEKFLEITMGAYEREVAEHFGKRVPGVFTDEPHLEPAGGLHWSANMPERFAARWGYDLLDNLPSIVRPVGDWRRVRHDWDQFLLEEMIAHWCKPYRDYCDAHDLEFTGHYFEHGWPGGGATPDDMAMYAWPQRPAIDCLMNQYAEGVNAQFGNARMVKELGSVANQCGQRRTLCEAYGAGGWDLRLEDMKRIGDWLYVLGVNTLNEHLSYVTVRGARKRDHPQSFSYHAPWWEAYHTMASYFTRLSLTLSEGEQINRVLLIEPTTTAWLYRHDGSTQGQIHRLGNSFQDLVNRLERVQAEYDMGCENILAREGSVRAEGGRAALVVGRRAYDLVILAPFTETLNAETMELLEKYVAAGGRVVSCGPSPAWVDGRESPQGAKLAEAASWKLATVDEAVAAAVERTQADGLTIQRAEGDRGILHHHRRRLDDGEILFLVNTSITDPTAGRIESAAQGFEQWDLETGDIRGYPFATGEAGVKADFTLPPCGSLLVFLSNKPCPPGPAEPKVVKTLRPTKPAAIRRAGPNVLTLDYVDVSAGGESLQNVYFREAQQFAFRKNGMDRNPWDNEVQLRDSLITKTFPPESGFEATYRFTIEGDVPAGLSIVIERPDLYTIACNGQPVSAAPNQWWLDRAFGVIDLAGVAKPGANEVTVKVAPFTIWHELEPAYVLGEFSLRPTDAGFVIEPPKPLDMTQRDSHATTPDGTMWLTAGIGRHGGDASKNDGAPSVTFDLGRPVDLSIIKIWNYNEVNLTQRGVKQLRVLASPTGKPDSFTELGTFTLDQARDGSIGPTVDPTFPRTLRVRGAGARFVRFDILSNHAGVTFPTSDASVDNAFVGLSEVQFFAKGAGGNEPIPGATIAARSSELGDSFDRAAAHLVDGSGLDVGGWDRQGCPFFSQGVAYTETFSVAKPEGAYRVALGRWHGSVARVTVNGQPAGYISHAPWELDATKWIRAGRNTVEVTVIGTLRNTLGPHHNGRCVGSAWPSAFWGAPKSLPPGESYSTLSYGLFEPFVLKQYSP